VRRVQSLEPVGVARKEVREEGVVRNVREEEVVGAHVRRI
jgi:hypothetical protein